MRVNAPVLTFNRGLISRFGLARTDLDRTRLSAETQTNWMPRVLGSMMLRPGTEYIGSTKSDAAGIHIPFIFATNDTAIVEITDALMRVRVSESLVTRASVSSTVTNGTFTSNLSGWTDDDDSGATSNWQTGGYMSLSGTRYSAAKRYQEVTVSGGDQGTEHALRIVIERGDVLLRVGSTQGDDDYITETTLTEGDHSLAFTPTGNFFIQLESNTEYESLVDSVAVESSGTMEITAPWAEADLDLIRWDQSADVVYIACDGYQQYKIERRGTSSWSLVKYLTEDGPFRAPNFGRTQITPSGLTGDISLTSTNPLFRSTHVGALFQLTSVGQAVDDDFTAEAQFGDYIRVSGVGDSRKFTIKLEGTWTATVHLQRSIGEPGSWEDVDSYTTNQNSTYDDGLDNQIIYYRWGVKAGNFTSGTVESSLTYASGGITGTVRVTSVTDSTNANAIVLNDLGGTGATEDWAEGSWSNFRGWPTSVAFYGGRLWFFGRGDTIGSVTDAYQSFDPDTEGDSGPINRSIGSGPVDVINWALPLQRLIIGTGGFEGSIRSTSFDEPLTPSNWNLKQPSSFGSAKAAAVKIDSDGIFVGRDQKSVYSIGYNIDVDDYAADSIMKEVPDLFEDSTIKRIAVQRHPDTRVHVVRDDGDVNIWVFDRSENVRAWITFETDGDVEDAFVLPGTTEDKVYYLVKRIIDGNTKRYLERWALESQCRTDSTPVRIADCHYIYSGSSTATITGLDHLEGESVVAWGGGKDLGSYTVSGGSVTLSESVTDACVGLTYNADYKSTKLAYGARMGTALTQPKRVRRIGLIMADVHYQGIKYGSSFSNLYPLPPVKDGKATADDTLHTAYDEEAFTFDGTWDADSRVCLRATAPRPCTVSGLVVEMEGTG